ncbi:hypothetical protein [Methylocystis sp.]|uniref:hypothetical protein n=1 Tax=Methylocystis sp. TaxID=1911079 RepID=UPI0025E2445F|nr:hypothetical protein [Methylocystis sp.]
MLRLSADHPIGIDLSRLMLSDGQTAGPFLVEGREARNKGSLRLRIPQCQRPIVLAATAFSETRPEKLLARFYPLAEWDARYVYHRHFYSNFADLPSKFVMRLRLLFLDLALQPREVTDNYIFAFHVPVGCAIDSGAALATVDSIIASHSSGP